MLVSGGAQAFARVNGLEIVEQGSMICPRSRAEWTRWKSALDSAIVTEGEHIPNITQQGEHKGIMQDTVGAVACDVHGDFSAGVSR